MPFSIRPFRCLPLTYCKGFLFLITLLLLSSSPAYAEWVVVSGNDESGMPVYVDPDTRLPKGKLVKMWILYNFTRVRTVAGESFFLTSCTANPTVHKRAIGRLWICDSRAPWDSGRWCITNHPKGSGHQLHLRVTIKYCGNWPATSLDRAAHEQRPPQTRHYVHRRSDYFQLVGNDTFCPRKTGVNQGALRDQ
jgi:hypothetical protein